MEPKTMVGQVEAPPQAGDGPELIIGLVTPIGTNTSALADQIRSELSKWHYRSHIVKVTDFFNKRHSPPQGEFEDERIRRLIDAGNAWCQDHSDPAAVARVAILDIQSTRMALHRQGGSFESEEANLGRPLTRQAYIIHSLKRPAEVGLLRQTYGPQFVLLGSQAQYQHRFNHLVARPLSASDLGERETIAKELIELDASEVNPLGQKVNETFPQADYFLRSDETPERFIGLLFGMPTLAPNLGELAMYLAQGTSLQSLSPSRRVGAALVLGASIISLGCNEVPKDELPDITTGEDPSERFKLQLLQDTLIHLKTGGLLRKGIDLSPSALLGIRPLLNGSQIMSVIEYQRAVHAEVAAISDAARRGQPVEGADLYCTTYPCHLCFKSALAVGIRRLFYIDPYPKSRASLMFPSNSHRLVPYEGVAPRMYNQVFGRPVVSSDEVGALHLPDAKLARPIFSDLFLPNAVADREAAAVSSLHLEHWSTE